MPSISVQCAALQLHAASKQAIGASRFVDEFVISALVARTYVPCSLFLEFKRGHVD
jgi:hypothetical protein